MIVGLGIISSKGEVANIDLHVGSLGSDGQQGQLILDDCEGHDGCAKYRENGARIVRDGSQLDDLVNARGDQSGIRCA
jgi:hypothetical protein